MSQYILTPLVWQIPKEVIHNMIDLSDWNFAWEDSMSPHFLSKDSKLLVTP